MKIHRLKRTSLSGEKSLKKIKKVVDKAKEL